LREAATAWQSDSADDPVLLAMGVTLPHTVPDPSGGPALNFPALPGVDQELKEVARYAGNPGGGVGG
jgi:hypothetical protein